MKIRKGFVSNSSSSSFIIKLPYYPKSSDDMQKMLLGDNNPLLLSDWDDGAFPTKQVIDIIYNDVINVIKSNKNLKEDFNFQHIHFYNLNDYDKIVDMKHKDEYDMLKREYEIYNNDLDKYYLITNKRDDIKKEIFKISQRMEEIVLWSIKNKKNDRSIYLMLEYGDEDGDICAFIEHGDILDPITITRISNH